MNDKQKKYHEKEARCISAMKKHFKRFRDVHDDWSTGVDVVINGRSYDLKVTDYNWLDVYKEVYKNGKLILEEYPLELHPDVAYLICHNEGSDYYCYLIDKRELLGYHLSHPRRLYPELYREFDGHDGNFHLAISISDLIRDTEPKYTVPIPLDDYAYKYYK